MKILIDATWVGGMYGSKVMHGGYRVTNEYLRRLSQFGEHQFILTSSDYQDKHLQNLKLYADREIGSKNVSVNARAIKFLDNPSFKKLYARLSRYIPVPYIYPFVSYNLLGKIDVFHAPADTIPGVIRRNKRIKKFFTALDLIPLVRPDLSNVFYDYTKVLYDSLTPDTNILAISECTKKDILKYRPDINPEKIRVTYLAANSDLFYFMPERNNSNNVLDQLGIGKKKYFLTVNSMARYKNVEYTIENFMNYISANNISDLYLVVIGQNREVNYKQYIEEKFGSAEKVIMFDFVEDDKLVSVFNHALGFLYMSRYEGFGLPILEAMQCGTPVICSNAASMPEVAGNAALVLDPQDSKAFIGAMNEVYESADLRENLMTKGLQHAKNFSWDKYAKEVVKAYEEM